MTITVTLQNDIEALLRQRAEERGISLDSLATEIFNRALVAELETETEAVLREDNGVFVVDSLLLADTEMVVDRMRIERDRQNLAW